MSNSRLGAAGDPLLLGGATSDPAQANVAQVVHRLLRGRYLVVILAGVVGAATGAAAGWFSQKPQFVCQGQVRVQSDLPTILPGTPTGMANLNWYVSTQVNLLQQPRVISKAMSSTKWRELGRALNSEQERAFRKHLRVINPPDAPEIIVVSFTDEERQAADVAVEEVIRGYEELYVGKDVVSDLRVSTLQEERNKLLRQIDEHEGKISELVREYGEVDLSERLRLSVANQMQLEQAARDIANELSRRGLKPGEAPAPAAPVERQPLTPFEISQYDQQMAQYLYQQREAQRQVDSMVARGVGEATLEMRRARGELEAAKKVVQNYAEDVRRSGVLPGVGTRMINVATATDEELLKQYGTVTQARDGAHDESVRIGRAQREVEREQRQIRELRSNLQEITETLDRYNLERAVPDKLGGRISILSYGDVPSYPELDPRKKFAAMGFVAGGGLPVAAVLLWGISRRRFRYSDEARDLAANVALLGVLPNLPKGGLADPEDAAAATHCVHQIRTMLQLGGKPQDKVYCMTSAEAGEGKTSLTLALGLSYARSGARTLLIDADMIGRGLTSDLAVRVEHGLGDALRAGQLNGTVMDTQFERVYVLPVGMGDERAIPEFTAVAARRLLEDARKEFDIILVDTGPILGSLEAACVTANADGVVMVVGRGQHRPRLERALEHLRSIHARVVGLVFNRAAATDFEQSSSSTSRRSVSASVSLPASVEINAQDRARMEEIGPLAGAVLTTWRRSE